MDKNVLQIEEYISKLEEEISRLSKIKNYDKEDLRIKRNLLASSRIMKKMLMEPSFGKGIDMDKYLLPEYRKDGYFQSKDFKDKNDEFYDYLKELESSERREFTRFEKDTLKQKFMKDRYGINWVPEEKQYMPGVTVIVD